MTLAALLLAYAAILARYGGRAPFAAWWPWPIYAPRVVALLALVAVARKTKGPDCSEPSPPLCADDAARRGPRGLLHDATEAYVGDMVRPLKRSMPEYRAVEDRLARAIEFRFGLAEGSTACPAVKRADEVLLATEMRDLVGGERAGKWEYAQMAHAMPLPDRIRPLTQRDAEAAFLARFEALSMVAA